MISLLSIAVNTVINFFVYILKAVFSMLMWFFSVFFIALKLFFCVLPLTGISFSILIIVNIIVLVSGSSAFLSLAPNVGGFTLFVPSDNTTLAIADALKIWWHENVYSYHGTGAYIPLFFLTIIMFIPVAGVFLCISAYSSFRLLILGIVVLDIAIYLVRTIAGNGIVSQYLGRYYFLFPDSGKRHYEKSYEKWLKKHHEEFEDDTYGHFREKDKYDDFYDEPVRSRDDDFYEEDYNNDYDDEYDSDYDDEHDSDYDGEYDSDRDDEYDSDCDDEYEGYDSDYEEDDEDDDEDDYHSEDDSEYHSEHVNNQTTSFNFFAGCNNRDSVEKKYRSLAKLYHPDNMDGDTASLQEINAQYEKAKKRFPR